MQISLYRNVCFFTLEMLCIKIDLSYNLSTTIFYCHEGLVIYNLEKLSVEMPLKWMLEFLNNHVIVFEGLNQRS